MTPTTEQSRRSPRQARSAETRRKLLDAGFEAFAAKGHDGVNLVEDVLEPAGISIGSFYHQFADKTELLPRDTRRGRDAASSVHRGARRPRHDDRSRDGGPLR